MKNINLSPLEGIEVEGFGTIAFGNMKAEVIKLLGEPSSIYGEQLFYDELELRIDLNAAGKVEFIECTYGPFCERTVPYIYGQRAFELPGEQLFALLLEKNNGRIDDSEREYGTSFLEISTGIYRSFAPADVLESIEESKAEGCYEEDKEWLEEDMAKARHYWTIGIGVENYYSS